MCHGLTWNLPVFLSAEEEVAFHKNAKDIILRVSGKNCTGFNAYWMEDSNNTLSILQDLGLNYHVDDISRDIPFTKMVCSYADPTKCKPFALVPYTLVNNDIELLGVRNFGSEAFYDQLVNEFDTLYRESKHMHRLMSISSHARYGGRPGAVNAYRRFIQYAGSHEGVWFVRKDWMATWALENGPRYNCPANPTAGKMVDVAPGQQVLSAPFCPESSCICGCGARAAYGSTPCKELDSRMQVV